MVKPLISAFLLHYWIPLKHKNLLQYALQCFNCFASFAWKILETKFYVCGSFCCMTGTGFCTWYNILTHFCTWYKIFTSFCTWYKRNPLTPLPHQHHPCSVHGHFLGSATTGGYYYRAGNKIKTLHGANHHHRSPYWRVGLDWCWGWCEGSQQVGSASVGTLSPRGLVVNSLVIAHYWFLFVVCSTQARILPCGQEDWL